MDCFMCDMKATHECNCLSTPIQYCAKCLSTHIISNLSMQHHSHEISLKGITPLCFECKSKFCEVICLCQRVGVCKSCLVYHISQPGSHFIDYIRVEKQSKDTFDMERKSSTTDNVRSEVQENI